MFKTNPERQRRSALLKEFLAGQPDGAVCSWVEIETATGVPMRTDSDRKLLYEMLHKLKREWIPIRGSGIELSSGQNAIRALRLRDKRIGGALVRAGKADVRIQAQHLKEMSPEDREETIMRGALRGALLSGARALKPVAKPITRQDPLLPQGLRKL